MRIAIRRTILGMWAALSALGTLAACDPLASEPTSRPVAVVQTTPLPTAIPSLVPTRTPRPTATATFTPSPAPTITPFICTETRGQLSNRSFESALAGRTVNYVLYLPPCYYELGRRYPYVILLGGADSNQAQWVNNLKVADAMDNGLRFKALPPMILVMPETTSLANGDEFRPGKGWDSAIMGELIPQLENTLCLWNERESRAIGGISRGGMWAFITALRNPDFFGAMGGHSPYFDRNYPPGRENNPFTLARTVAFAPGTQPRIWLDVGSEDGLRREVESMRDTLNSRQIKNSYIANPEGQHSDAYWLANLTDYLAFYGQTQPMNTEDLPSCVQ
jgi:enterochelin esterase-like enzyme